MGSQKADNGGKQGAGNQFVKFSRQSAQRIAKAVRTVEGGNRDQLGIVFDHPMPGGSKTFRVCTFTGTWAIDGTKTLTFKYQTSTPNTVVATNLVCGLNPSTTCDALIAKDGTAWFLVQPNFTKLPGYSTAGTQVMVIASGNLCFVGTTAC